MDKDFLRFFKSLENRFAEIKKLTGLKSVEEFNKLYPTVIRRAIIDERYFSPPSSQFETDLSKIPELPYPFHIWVEQWGVFFMRAWRAGQQPPGPVGVFNFDVLGRVIAVEELASHILQESAIRFTLVVEVKDPFPIFTTKDIHYFRAYYWLDKELADFKLRTGTGLTIDEVFKVPPDGIYVSKSFWLGVPVKYKGVLRCKARVKISELATSVYIIFQLSSC